MKTSGASLAARRLFSRIPLWGRGLLALAAAISYSRVYVGVYYPGALEEDIDRLEPHLIVCEPPIPENPGYRVPAWIELSIDPAQASRFRVGQRSWESLNPGLEELLAVVAKTEGLSEEPPR
jgi:hypothetical protein